MVGMRRYAALHKMVASIEVSIVSSATAIKYSTAGEELGR
jgi:hypothetical protein